VAGVASSLLAVPGAGTSGALRKRGHLPDTTLMRSAVEALVTVVDWLRWTATRFAGVELHYGHGTDNPWDEAVALVRGFLRLPHDRMEFVLGARLTERERAQLLHLVETRVIQRVPVPYLTGEAYFAGRSYRVTRDVLIPRSPIAELIEAEFAPWVAAPPATILDLCTGSGCIGIACAHQFPSARVTLTDVDAAAVELARSNARAHGVADRIEVIESDLFEALDGRRFDLVVTNPPYVDEGDLAEMPAEFRHEPRLALAAGPDGLDLIRRILADAHRHLTPDGTLVGEAGASIGALLEAYPDLPFELPTLTRGGEGVFVLGAANLPR
jgi:ribosomal protein L3 glutamine methyltransferase